MPILDASQNPGAGREARLGLAAQLRAALARPLITGASVSADQRSLSPGKKLARRYDPAADIRTVAFGGTMGTEVLRRAGEEAFAGRSAVIAIDLFFWDSALARPTAAVSSLCHLLKTVRALNIPLVLGEVPELIPGHQPGRPLLNDAIHRARAEYALCAVMPFERIFRRMMQDGFLEIRGKRYGLFDLVPDGLHLASFAGDYLADVLEAEMLGIWGG